MSMPRPNPVDSTAPNKRARGKPFRKRTVVGPHSRKFLARGIGGLDLRTSEGKFAAHIRQALLDHIGRPATAAEQLIISGAAIKALRCELLASRVLDPNGFNNNDNYFLAWSNSLRRDLEAIGVGPRAQPVPSLSQYLVERRKRGDAA